MTLSIFLIVISFIGFYFSIILYCDHRTTKNCYKLSNKTQLMNEKECVEFYGSFLFTILMKQPVDNLIYLIDIISTNMSKILICTILFLGIYGWLIYTSDMRRVFVDLYYELKSTTGIVAQELWSAIRQSTMTVWNTLSIIKFVQFAFLLLLLLSVPDMLDYLKKGLIKFAKL